MRNPLFGLVRLVLRKGGPVLPQTRLQPLQQRDDIERLTVRDFAGQCVVPVQLLVAGAVAQRPTSRGDTHPFMALLRRVAATGAAAARWVSGGRRHQHRDVVDLARLPSTTGQQLA